MQVSEEQRERENPMRGRERGKNKGRKRERESHAGSALSMQSPRQDLSSPEVGLELTNPQDPDQVKVRCLTD